jgi:hypothetical protein
MFVMVCRFYPSGRILPLLQLAEPGGVPKVSRVSFTSANWFNCMRRLLYQLAVLNLIFHSFNRASTTSLHNQTTEIPFHA